jgi:CheY-like chemotaxis protein
VFIGANQTQKQTILHALQEDKHLQQSYIVRMACVYETNQQCSTADEKNRAMSRTSIVMPRVLVADDQDEVRKTVESLLEGEFQVVGLAEDGMRVLRLVPVLSPDVVILDIFMPELNGIEAALRLKRSGSNIKVIFLTVHDDPDFLAAALSAGAQGYVLKPHLATDLVPALWNVLAGRTFVSPTLHAH